MLQSAGASRPKWALAVVLGTAAILSATRADAAQLVTNGDFATGDFTGWTVFTTSSRPNSFGVAGVAPGPLVTVFDVSGAGPSQAAQLQVGRTAEIDTPEGGGLLQTITTREGRLTFSADFAVFPVSGYNGSGGIFSVLLDGVQMDVFDTGQVFPFVSERGSLTFSADVTAGAHVLAIQVLRGFAVGAYAQTPFQYLDHVSAVQADVLPPGPGVPEPGAWSLMIAGFALAGRALRRRARAAT